MGVLCQLYTKFDSTASIHLPHLEPHHPIQQLHLPPDLEPRHPIQQQHLVPFGRLTLDFVPLKWPLLALDWFFARVVLKIPFSSSHSKGSRCKRLVSFLAKSALMLSTGVTLSFSSIEPKICPRPRLRSSFLRDDVPSAWVACPWFSDLPLIFLLSSWHCWFSRAQRKLLWQV